MNSIKRGSRPYTFLKATTSVCPECLEPIPAHVITRDGKVYFHKYCPTHGESEALVSEDVEYYLNAYHFARPGSVPLKFSTAIKRNCPKDCGLCPAHQQHTCLPIVEITDFCNLDCPICIADNRNRHHMSVEDFSHIVDYLVEHEGSLETITFSGGEPTLHPKFFELVDAAKRPEIGRVSVVTNGTVIAKSREFCEKLKAKNVYAVLQMDAFSDEAFIQLRGEALMEQKKQALANLEEFEIPTQIVFVAARGVNEHQIGDAVKLLLAKKNILSLMIQPFAATGARGGNFPFDPMNRCTIPGIIKDLAEQSAGLLQTSDFIPLPCSHPHCVSLTYLLAMDDGSYMPFPRFIDMDKYLGLFQQTATLEPGQEVEDAMRDTIADLWSSSGETPDCDRVINAMRRALKEMFPKRPVERQELIRIAERQAKTIFIHHYMDRFNFDMERIVKCCHHYPQVDGRIMPACARNMFYRNPEAAKGRATKS